MDICVVGLGKIGFNLLKFLMDRFPERVIGVDVDRQRIKQLQELGYKVTSNYQELTTVDTWLLAPSTGNRAENLFAALAEMIINPGALISIESTLPPGTMEQVRVYLLGKGFTLGQDLFLIHVPHRVLFGVDKTVCDTPRVMGAFTQGCLEKGRQFYQQLVPSVVEVTDVRVAELAKVVENVKRFVDIAFAEEIYRYCVHEGIAFQELRRAVNSKQNVELLATDWGIGGECLPKDMNFLRAVFGSPLLQGAELSDRAYREEVVRRVGAGRRVLVKGLTYKPGVKDLEHSRAVALVRRLQEHGNRVMVADPLFADEELAAEGFQPLEPNSARDEGKNDSALSPMPEVILERHRALEPIVLLNEGLSVS